MPKLEKLFEGGHCLSEAELLEFALDGMEEPLRSRAAEHLTECDECREQVAALLDLHIGLASLAPDAEPPPGLRARVRRDVKRKSPPS
jgi:predicted anti-sigma-YlaC factor YlaD